MRASRLVAIVLLLQSRSRLTAAQLASELDVSERTIYRDLDALDASGIPIYAESGPGGGYRLVEGYQTRLTGLSSEEAQALVLAGVPRPLGDLGLGVAASGGRRKLLAALPGPLRAEAAKAQERYHVDLAAWFQRPAVPPLLGEVAAAVWSDRRMAMTYRPDVGTARRREVDPLGLVVKVSTWYLVAASRGRASTFRVDRIADLELLDVPASRPAGFDLAAFWDEQLTAYEASLPTVRVVVRARPRTVPELRHLVDQRSVDTTDWTGGTDGAWRRLVLTFERLDEAEAALLPLGDAVEVLEPQELRASMSRTVNRLRRLYATDAGPG